MAGLTMAFTLSVGAMSAAIVHLIPYLTDHGWSDVRAAVAAGILGATQVVARVVFAVLADKTAPARLALVVLIIPAAGIVVLAVSNGAALAWLSVALLGIGQGTSTLLRPLLLSRRLMPDEYGWGAATSAAWSTVARAVAPLLLAGAAGAGSAGYPVGFAAAVIAAVTGAIVAYRSLLMPPPVPRPVAA
jgi:cyanate permease